MLGSNIHSHLGINNTVSNPDSNSRQLIASCHKEFLAAEVNWGIQWGVRKWCGVYIQFQLPVNQCLEWGKSMEKSEAVTDKETCRQWERWKEMKWEGEKRKERRKKRQRGRQCCIQLQLAPASIKDVLSHLVRNSTTASPRNSSLSLWLIL